MKPGWWISRDFSIFLVVQALSALGDGFAMVAVPLLVLSATGSVAQMGLITGVTTLSALVTGVFSGLLVDRLDRRRLMIVCDLARTVVYGAIPLVWLAGPQVWALYPLMVLAGAFSNVSQVGFITAMANLVDRDMMVTANGRMQVVFGVSFILGPGLAGAVAGVFGPTTAVAVDAVSFAVSAAGLAMIRFRTGERPEPTDLRSGLLAGVKFLWRHPPLRALTFVLTVVLFIGLGVTDTFIYYVHNELHHNDSVVGVMLGVSSLGSIVAAALTPWVRGRLGFGACCMGSLLTSGVSVAILGFSTDIVVVVAMGMAYTFAGTVMGICSMSLRQMVTPDHLLGRVTAAFWTVQNSASPLGAALLTAAVGAYGARVPLLVVAGVFVVVAVIAAGTSIRQRHPEETEVP